MMLSFGECRKNLVAAVNFYTYLLKYIATGDLQAIECSEG
jgi:hypothetical protein